MQRLERGLARQLHHKNALSDGFISPESRLISEERMDFWNAEEDGGPVDTAYNGNMKACTYRIREAHDDEIKKVDCYTLGDPVGCLRVYMPSPGDTERQGYGTGM